MATESSERVVQMKANFMELHEAGLTIQEIADKFHLSRATMYRHLEAIALENGVTRESLLQQVHQTPTYWAKQNHALKVDGNQLLAKFDSAQQALSEITEDITTIINIIEEDLR